VNYTLAEESNVDIRLIDVAGRDVAVISQGAQAAGTYRETMNTANLPNGVYIVRMQVGKAVSTRRMTIAH
jgi:hypothetical protein